MSAEQSIYIHAPVDEVFDYCADPRRSWAAGPGTLHGELLDVRPAEGGVGTHYTWAMKVAGMRLEGFDVYTEFVPNERFSDRSSWSFAGTWTFRVEPEGEGTRLTVQRKPASFWALGPVDRLVDRLLVTPLSRQTLRNVKAALEEPAEAAAEPAATATEPAVAEPAATETAAEPAAGTTTKVTSRTTTKSTSARPAKKAASRG